MVVLTAVSGWFFFCAAGFVFTDVCLGVSMLRLLGGLLSGSAAVCAVLPWQQVWLPLML